MPSLDENLAALRRQREGETGRPRGAVSSPPPPEMRLPGGLGVADYRRGPTHFVASPAKLVSPHRLVRLERQARLASTLHASPGPLNDGGARVMQAELERRKLAATARDDEARRAAAAVALAVTPGQLLRKEHTASFSVRPVSWAEVEAPPDFVESVFTAARMRAKARPEKVVDAPARPLERTLVVPPPASTEAVCGACAAEQLPRCAYCLLPKHATVTRVPLAQLPRLLLAADPSMKAVELARRLAKYGRSDDYARELHSDQLGKALPEKDTCKRHKREYTLAEQFELKCEKRYINEMTKFITESRAHEEVLREASRKADEQRLLFADAVEEADAYKTRNAILRKRLDATLKELATFDDATMRREAAERYVDCSTQTDQVAPVPDPSSTQEKKKPAASAAALAFAQAASKANESGAEALAARIARKKAKPKPPLYATRALANELLAAKLRNTPAHEGHFADFLYAFWRSKDLNRKQVTVKVAETVASIDEHKSVDDTVRAVAILLGLEEIRIGQLSVAAGKSAWLAPAWFGVVRKLVKEYLDPDLPADNLGAFLAARATAVLDPTQVARAVAEAASPDEPSPCLRQMLAPHDVGAVLKVILTLPSLPPKYGAQGGISFGDVTMLLLEHMAAAVARHHRKLLETFYKFDTDDNGLDGDEFRMLLEWTTGPAQDGDRSAEAVHSEIEDVADADAAANLRNGAIDEADQFPEVIMASTQGKLAYAEACRDYWRMDADATWGVVAPKISRKATVGGLSRKEAATVGREGLND